LFIEEMKDIKDLGLKGLEAALLSWGERPFRARQIFSWIYKKGVISFEAMSDLPSALRKLLKENFYIVSLKLIKEMKSADGTKKLLFELEDHNFVEAVIIPTGARATGCISSQVGCKFACSFCASGKLGFKRNLTTQEITEEVLYLKNNCEKRGEKITHIVFMGIGEPLDNYDNVIRAIRIINSPGAFNIGARRITVSTAGIIPAIKRLSREGLQIELSVSLHAVDGMTRPKIMSVDKIYPLKDLISACREYIKKTNRQITFEYTLIKGINSTLQDALKLSRILKGINCKVNLIPSNAIKEMKVAPPDKTDILSFRNYLIKAGINVTLRRPRGEDIEAACGQLRLRYEKE